VLGSGGGLLQKVNRDTLRFAMKNSYLEVNGVGRDVYKAPKTDLSKASKKGRISLYRKNATGEFFSATPEEIAGKEGWCTEALVEIYKNGVILREYTLDEVRQNTGLW
jgi:nicotinamide phosphoribosyltransferase